MFKPFNHNGIYIAYPAPDRDVGYREIADLLNEHYSPFLSEQEYIFDGTPEEFNDNKGRQSWKHTLYRAEYDNIEAKLTVGEEAGSIVIKHLGSYVRKTGRNTHNIDYPASPVFTGAQTYQKYWIFFNIDGDSTGIAASERDRFSSFLERKINS
ncbi:hypothetical protein D6764_01400 [Candidatus Woesearchaeota archaeon]|nr:MAG: hypothetical protein D6764_01400 [Candidatus Woesearchaeota archaeon]